MSARPLRFLRIDHSRGGGAVYGRSIYVTRCERFLVQRGTTGWTLHGYTSDSASWLRGIGLETVPFETRSAAVSAFETELRLVEADS